MSQPDAIEAPELPPGASVRTAEFARAAVPGITAGRGADDAARLAG